MRGAAADGGVRLWLLVILAGLLAIPTTVLCLEIVAGLVRRQVPTSPGRGAGRRIAVLVPAHNESVAIAATLEDIKAQLRPGDRLLVVADNCTDDTAAVAGLSGAEVVKRQDSERIGKGYALDWGLRHLDKDPPDVVIVIDADCRLSEGSIARLTGACSMTGRPVQALDLMTAPAGSGINKLIAEFAWRVKNWVRPLGLAGLGLPCQMAGHRHGHSLASSSRCRSRERMDCGRLKARARSRRRRPSTAVLPLGARDKPVRCIRGRNRYAAQPLGARSHQDHSQTNPAHALHGHRAR